MLLKDSKKGIDPMSLFITVTAFAIVALIVMTIHSQTASVQANKACENFCEMRREAKWWLFSMDPRKSIDPGSMNCLCGVTKEMGKILHIKADLDENDNYIELFNWHLSNLDPTVMSDYKVGGNTDLTNDCDIKQEDWIDISDSQNQDKCLIFVVEKDNWPNDDECALYGVEENTIISYNPGDSIWSQIENTRVEDHVFTSYDGDPGSSPEDVLKELEFNDPVRANYGDGMKGQVFLLQKLYMDGQQGPFTLFTDVICKNKGGTMVWELKQ